MAKTYWAAAALRHNQVRLALNSLERIGYEVYAPRIRAGHNGATQLLFPSYCFISIGAQWWAATRAPGVVKLVLEGQQPARLRDEVIEALRAREDPSGYVILPRAPRPSGPRRGDRIRVIGGPFLGQLGIFQNTKPRDRVAILLAVLGGARTIVLARRDIALARPKAEM
jgi:transcriptional antiterminator RfaH